MLAHPPLPRLLLSTVCLAMLTTPGLPSRANFDTPLTPAEARQRIGEEVRLRMTVRVAKDRLEKRGEIYLDSEADFRDPKNFATVITTKGAKALRAAGIGKPAGHFRGKRILVHGTVQEVDGVPRIEVDSAEQIELVTTR